MSYFAMTSPESLGIDSAGILKFIDACEHEGLELHRLMILRHGKCCAKVTWEPYREDDLHPMYSFSKSLTATAIAFARQEGLLTLDEKIVDIFPECVPEDPSENLLACTIHHLLCMSCGQETEIRDAGPDWKKKFMAHPFLHKPGTFYKYNTTGTNMLAAIVKKKTGLQVTEYLRPRLLDPLGMGEIFCYQLPDELQTQYGGGGMKMTLEDMAKFAQFMLQDGCWEGKQLLGDWYFARAGVKQMETAGDSEGHVYEWANGYGYQCWMGTPERSFRADGAFGQFGLVYPTMDLCIMTSSATEQTQTMIDYVNSCILPAVKEDGLVIPAVNAQRADGTTRAADTKETDGTARAADMKETDGTARAADTKETAEAVQAGNDAASEDPAENCGAILQTRSLIPLSSCRNPVFEQILQASVYRPAAGTGLSGLQVLVGGAGLIYVEAGEITQICFRFGKDSLFLHLTEDGEEKTLEASLKRSFTITEIDGIRYAASARWRSLRRLEIEIRRMDAMSGVRLILTFTGDRLSFEADETLMTDGGLGMTARRLPDFRQVADMADLTIEKTGNNPGVEKNES